MEKPKIIAVVGPTASGKTSLALKLAKNFQGEIISADSVQVYRGLDIGTAKPSLEERRLIPHHLIDILDPDQDYSAALFRKQADEIIHGLHKRQTPVFVAGGTGLYLKALTRGLFNGPASNSKLRTILNKQAEAEGSEYLHCQLKNIDPQAASRIHPRDALRIIRAIEVYAQCNQPISSLQGGHGFQEKPYEVLKIGLTLEKNELYRRIEARTEEMIKKGWVEEVRSLLHKGYHPRLKSLQSIGYKQIVSYLSGEVNLPEAVDLIKRDTRHYAKRQITWFKADAEINWFTASPESLPMTEKRVEEFLE